MLESPLTRIVACFLAGILLVFGIAAIGSLTLLTKLIVLLVFVSIVGIWYLSLSHPSQPQASQAGAATVPLTRYDAPTLVRRGWVAWERGDDLAAIAAFDQALQLNPDLVAAYLGRSKVYFQLANLPAAIADCQQAIQRPINQPLGFYQRGNFRYDLGDREGAKADFEQAIALEAEHSESVTCETARDYYLRGLARYRLDDPTGAIADLVLAAQLSEATPDHRVHQQVMDLIQEIQP